MLSSRFAYHANAQPVVPMSQEAISWVGRWHEVLRASQEKLISVPSPCGANPNQEESVHLADRDRYGFPLSTWLSKKSGIAWTSPQMNEELTDQFYQDYFHNIYRDPNDSISKRFSQQIMRSFGLLEQIEKANVFSDLSGKRVLDVGCAAGGMLIPFLEQGCQVAGCEIGGTDYIDFGNKLGLNLRSATTTQLIEEGKCYDIVVMSHVLEHIADPITFLQELRSLISDGGLLAIEVPGIKNLGNYQYDFQWYLQNSHTHHYCASSLTSLLSNAGYQVIRANEVVRVIAQKTEEPGQPWDSQLWSDILRYLKRTNHLSSALRPAYWAGHSGKKFLRKQLGLA